MKNKLIISDSNGNKIFDHLNKKDAKNESAAFALVDYTDNFRRNNFNAKEIILIDEKDMVFYGNDSFDIKQETISSIIKNAKNINCGLIEFHTHINGTPAIFSNLDISGINKFMPYVLWRLNNKPYGAVVISGKSCDSLLWKKRGSEANIIDEIIFNKIKLNSSGYSKVIYDYKYQ